MIIGMTISAIIIAMVYYIYINLSRQMQSYAQQQEILIQYNQFQNVWSREIATALTVKEVEDGSVKMEFLNNEIQYDFEREYVLRRQEEQIDTFDIKVKGINIDIKENKEKTLQVFRIQTELLGEPIEIFEYKELKIANRINEHFLNEH